jgi:integrase
VMDRRRIDGTVDAQLAPAGDAHVASQVDYPFIEGVQRRRLNCLRPAQQRRRVGDPAKGVGELGLPPLEPRALTDAQICSLKNLCDRLPRFYTEKWRRWTGTDAPPHAKRWPYRDRALVFQFLSTGLRREEVITLDLTQPQ